MDGNNFIRKEEINESAASLQKIFLKVYGTYEIDKSCLWLTEEVGEFIAAIRKGKSREEIQGELGDIAVWVFSLANSLGFNLCEIVSNSIDKEVSRQITKYGTIKNWSVPNAQ
ncbi:hypothetical protein CC205_27575 [Pseudomonas savastanoi pv. nerii]|uniref:NTP pyrophosphohydrolase MazG-like domain-containing protein n=1 Tax=Pseudomonas savastanoi pv. nerii TaxID=360921 RepID=A0AB73QZY4_PSESS|nr:MazG nucleotide pyrophosphohydrolase domain-containing protein [Pseudomonas savastanoi]PAB24562.1 hypothetical protein CC205_27575 [Pseudomonas savastanoi pv. nerii]PAB34392.1 hypothetical protein CC202_07615 [Pseudomonas savastanoi]